MVPLSEWRSIAHALGRMTDEECRTRLRESSAATPATSPATSTRRVYKFASRAVAPLIGMLMSPMQTLRHPTGAFNLRALDGRVVLEGPIGSLRKLAEKGTLVFVPTHLSNLDSVVFGFALERAGLPPATYGAGKNLFTNPVLSYFMHNLGAYRVDRRLKHGLYKEVLKSLLVRAHRARLPLAVLPGRHAVALGRRRAKAQARPGRHGVEAMARTAARGQSAACSSCRRPSTTC